MPASPSRSSRSKSQRKTTATGGQWRPSWGFADGLGLVGLLVLVAYFPAFRDPINLPRMAVLWLGALALAPFVVWRWRTLPGRRRIAVPATAAAGILAWALMSTLLSGNPWPVSVFGWWGRSDGLLTLFGVVTILLAAATLTRNEIRRLGLWLTAAFTALALVGWAQLFGANWGQQPLDLLMGNPNISAGVSAVGVLILGGLVFDPQSALGIRIWRASVALSLAVVAYQTGSTQGPATIALGAIGALLLYGLASAGRIRLITVSAGAVLAGLTVAIGIGALLGIGPGAPIWSDINVEIRRAAWGGGVGIIAGHPVFGAGPAGVERYFFEYVPQSYVSLVGPQVPVNALHNLPLQFGATLGVAGLLMWLVVFVGALLLLGRVAARREVSPAMAAAVGGGLFGYIVQGMVSIDMVALMMLGWLVAGCAMALVRTSAPDGGEAEAADSTPPGVAAISATLVVAGAFVVFPQVSAIPPGGETLDQQRAVAIITNPLTPCHIRLDIAAQASQALPPEVAGPAVEEAWRIDPRCLTMSHVAAQTALNSGDLELAGQATAEAIAIDPTFVTSWTLRARYDALTGNVEAAQRDLDRAREEAAFYPDPAAYEAEIAELERAISALQ